MLSKNGLPLYFQAENYMREKIRNGEWQSGQQIPTELQLMKLFGVSRATLRQAISDLCNEGLLNRIQGKGTFVMDLSGYNNDPTEIWDHPEEGVHHRPISCVSKTGLEKKSAQLGVDPQEQLTVISYLHLLETRDNVPYNLSISYFPVSKYPHIEDYFYTDMIYNISKNIYSIVPAYTKSEFHVAHLTKERANFLEVKPNTPTIKIEKVYYDSEGVPLFETDIFTHPINSLIQIRTNFH